MVLDNASNSEGFADSSAPPSDSDGYDSNTGNYYKYTVPANLPSSIFLNKNKLHAKVSENLQKQAVLIRRDLTKEEADFSAHWTAKALAIRSYGYPAGAAVGAWRAINTRDSYRLPFMPQTMAADINPEIFPHRMMPLITGPLAKSTWQTVRVSLFVAVSAWIGDLIFASYGATSSMLGAATDRRGKSYFETLGKIREQQEQQRGQPVAGTRRVGNGNQQYKNTEVEAEADNIVGGYEEPPPSTGGYVEPSPSTGAFDAQSNEENPSPRGSAWDRLRQQAATGKPPAPKFPAKPPKVNDEFSKSDDAIESARARAQREFDEQVERERHGGSFNSGKGGSDRW